MKINAIICRRVSTFDKSVVTAYLKNGDGKIKTFVSREEACRQAEIISVNAPPNVTYEATAIDPALATTKRW